MTIDPTPVPAPQPCCICGLAIGPADSYGLGALPSHRYHWDCIRKEAIIVLRGTEFAQNPSNHITP